MIRMAAAAARAPTPLRASTFRIEFLVLSILVEVARSQGRVMGAGKIDVAVLASEP